MNGVAFRAQRGRLLVVELETCYITHHYRDHPWVLLRLPQILARFSGYLRAASSPTITPIAAPRPTDFHGLSRT